MFPAGKFPHLGSAWRAGRASGVWPRLRKDLVVAGVLAATFLVPRMLTLDRIVTPDEKRWLAQSANFYQALRVGNLKATYQIEHPGVPVMWVGAAAFVWRYPDYIVDNPSQFDWYRGEIAYLLRDHGQDAVALLAASRLLMALALTVIFVASFAAALRLLGFRTALAGFLILALDPFHIAHSRLLHLDGMSSGFVLLALLCVLNYLYRGGRRSDLVLSGISAGLAGLTKSPALFLAPFVGLLVLLELWGRWRRVSRLTRPDWAWAARTLAVWGLAGTAAFVLVWPAMWVDPLGTLWQVLRGAVGYAAEGHEDPLFFNGVVSYGDPGFHFYPVSFLWRTTPLVLLGLGLLAGARLARFEADSKPHWQSLGRLLLFAGLFTLFMNLGAKKFDRYLLPVYPPLELLAGAGWVAAAGWGRQRALGRLAQSAVPLAFGAALAGQAMSAAATHPYYLTYYNPLLGGPRQAPRVMMLGWGEGLDQAAAYLNAQPDAASLRVITGVWRGTFAYFFEGQVTDSSLAPGALARQDWLEADYCLIYINQWQRNQLPVELLDYLAGQEPAHVVRLMGVDYAYLYDIRGQAPPDYLVDTTAVE